MTMLMEQRADSPSRAEGAPHCAEGLRLVMADDDRGDQQLVLHALERARVQADISFHDDGAWLVKHLAMLELHQLPDLILLDLQMPHLDGIGVLGELQGHPILWQIPVLVLTAAAGPGDRKRAHASGATYFDVKPRSFDEMVELARLFPRLARRSSYSRPPSWN